MLSYGEYVELSKEEQTAYDDARVQSTDLAGAVRKSFETAKRHRDSCGVTDRMMFCIRAYNGEYSQQQLAEIAQFGGSTSFARITAVKARTASALLTDIFLGADRPWEIEPTPSPTLPEDIHSSIKELAMAEANASGQPLDAGEIKARMAKLLDMAILAAKEQATSAAKKSAIALDDILVEGQFYAALKEFLKYFTIYPVSVLKGPFFRMHRRVKYVGGMPTVVEEPMMHFSSPHPMDVWFAPGASSPEDGDVVERVRLSKFDLEALRGAPNYDADAIDAVLHYLPDGHTEITSGHDQARADAEEKESPLLNDTGLYDILEFHGWIAGSTVASEPLMVDHELDSDRSHHVTVRTLNDYVISVQPNPDPMERNIYDVASFESVPGSIYGRGLPEILVDVQALANAALRATINNIGLASGPQVGINTSAMGENTNSQDMYPWKRWLYASDPAAPTAPPLMFFQPQDNSQSLLAVLDRAMMYADEMSAIPRFASGSERVGGAGKTASGLAMLMGNVSKVFGYTAQNIDEGILVPKLKYLYDLKLLTDDTGMFRGDESVRPRGATFAAKAEVERTRALEFLQLTANPIDLQIVGPQGRALVLSEVAEHLGFDHNRLALAMQEQARAPQQVPGGPGTEKAVPANNQSAPGTEGPPRVNEGLDNAQRTAGAGGTVG